MVQRPLPRLRQRPRRWPRKLRAGVAPRLPSRSRPRRRLLRRLPRPSSRLSPSRLRSQPSVAARPIPSRLRRLSRRMHPRPGAPAGGTARAADRPSHHPFETAGATRPFCFCAGDSEGRDGRFEACSGNCENAGEGAAGRGGARSHHPHPLGRPLSRFCHMPPRQPGDGRASYPLISRESGTGGRGRQNPLAESPRDSRHLARRKWPLPGKFGSTHHI